MSLEGRDWVFPPLFLQDSACSLTYSETAVSACGKNELAIIQGPTQYPAGTVP